MKTKYKIRIIASLAIATFLVAVAGTIDKRYEATVLSNHDGDTITVIVDLGLETSRKEVVRLAGIDAPEMGTPKGADSRDRLRALVVGRTVVLEDKGREKYGRMMAVVWVGVTNVNQLLVDEGLAKPYAGGKRTP